MDNFSYKSEGLYSHLGNRTQIIHNISEEVEVIFTIFFVFVRSINGKRNCYRYENMVRVTFVFL